MQLLQAIWQDEEVPHEFAQTNFVMMFKKKGTADDPSKYRCVGMLNHNFKTLSQCLLTRLEKETHGFLSD